MTDSWLIQATLWLGWWGTFYFFSFSPFSTFSHIFIPLYLPFPISLDPIQLIMLLFPLNFLILTIKTSFNMRPSHQNCVQATSANVRILRPSKNSTMHMIHHYLFFLFLVHLPLHQICLDMRTPFDTFFSPFKIFFFCPKKTCYFICI